MQPEYDLSWILPYVRESMRGVGNFNFDGYADAVLRILEKVGTPSVQKFQPVSYTGQTYNFDAAHHDIKSHSQKPSITWNKIASFCAQHQHNSVPSFLTDNS
jgi:hypothetical protein